MNQEDILRLAIAIPLPEGSIGFGTLETRALYLGKEAPRNGHFFLCIDPARFIWPKPVDFDISFYSRMATDAKHNKPFNTDMRVFLDPETLTTTQRTLQLEVQPARKRRKQAEDGSIDILVEDELNEDVDLPYDPALLLFAKDHM